MKRISKRSTSILVIICMLVGLLPVFSLTASAGFTNGTTIISSTSGGTTLANGYVYTVSGSPTITGSAGGNGLNVAANSTAVINIPSGSTLTVNGGVASGGSGGGAGIYLPSSSVLIITGGGTLTTNGGTGSDSKIGSIGANGYLSISGNQYKGGYGGSGGNGGIGASNGGGGAGAERNSTAISLALKAAVVVAKAAMAATVACISPPRRLFRLAAPTIPQIQTATLNIPLP